MKAKLWFIQFFIVLSLLLVTQFGQLVFGEAVVGSPLKLNADLTALFDSEPEAKQSAGLDVAEIISKSASSLNILLIGAEKLNVAIEHADKFASALNKLNLVSSVKIDFSQITQLPVITQQYLPFKQQLLSKPMSQLLIAGNDDEIFNYQFSLLNQITNQAVSLTAQQAPHLGLADFLSRPTLGSSALTQKQGRLVSEFENKNYVFISFSTISEGIDVDSAQAFADEFSELIYTHQKTNGNASTTSDIEYLYTGAIFYTSKASRIGQNEMMLYGGISILATLLLIAFVYRKITAIVATFTLITISFVYGYLALALFYNEISIIALIFSVTLIGIAADYGFHAITELKFAHLDNKTVKQPLASIKMSLIMSFVTTGAGYALLMLAPFSLFQHIAIFTLFGLFGALITVLLLYPILLPLLRKRVDINEHSMPAFSGFFNQLQRTALMNIKRLKITAAVLFISVFALMFSLTFDNDIRRYYSADTQLQANEDRVKAVLNQKWDLPYFLVKADNEQGVLQLEEKLTVQLDIVKAEGKLAGYSAISEWLPSVNKQLQNKQLLTGTITQGKMHKLQSMLTQANWQLETTFFPLLPDPWFKSALGKIYASQWHEHEGDYYSAVKLTGVKKSQALNDLAEKLTLNSESNGSIILIDKVGRISSQLSQFSDQLLWVIVAAIIAALVVFINRYGWQVALLAIATPVFSLMVALLCSDLIQEHLTIFNLVAGLLVLALGLDYSVFYAEHGLDEKVTLTTIMSASSSVFVFAILIFSSMNAINSFGLTVFIGVLITFLLAPIVTLANGQSKVYKEK